ncbi:MATE family efflux transporter [Nocardia aurea]|uniref:MATE family efflux transporter n=1 Tax=Nocardia aurea TaxID=2144174 RepID=UPI0033BC115D
MTDTRPPLVPDLGFGGRMRQVAAIAVPIILTSATTVVVGATDTALLGHHSSEALGVAALVIPLWIFSTALVMPWGSATQVFVARWHGARDEESIRVLARAGLVGAVVIGAGFAVLGAMVTPVILAWTAPVGLDRGEATAMMWVLLCALPFTAATGHLRGLLAGVGDTGAAARVALLVAVLNLSVSSVLIFGADLGAVGSGIGSSIAIAVGAAVLYTRARSVFGRGRRSRGGTDRALLRSWVAVAVPDVVFGVVSYGSEVAVAAVAASLGTVSLAAHRMMSISISLVWMFVYGTAAAMAILIGQRIGADDRDGRLAFVRAGTALMLSCAGTTAVLLAVAAKPFFGIFTTDSAMIAAAAAVVWSLPVLAPIMAIGTVYAAQLRAAADTRGVMYASLFSTLCVTLPVVWMLTEVCHLGLVGVYCGLIAGWVARTAATYLRYRQTTAGEVDCPA